jgi:hypothetical protein
MSAAPRRRYPVERKVKAATAGALIAVFITAWIIRAVPPLAGMADEIQAAIEGLIGAAVAWGSGYAAHHTPRPEPPPESYRPPHPLR